MAFGSVKWLRQIGFLNEVADYKEITSTPIFRRRVAICTSNQCAGGTSGVLAHDKGGDCCSCGHSVVWKNLTEGQIQFFERRERRKCD